MFEFMWPKDGTVSKVSINEGSEMCEAYSFALWSSFTKKYTEDTHSDS